MFRFSKFSKFHVKFWFNTVKKIKIRKFSSATLRISKLKPKESDRAMKFIQDKLKICEPLMRGLNIENSPINPGLIEFIRDEIDQGMTFVAATTRKPDISKCFGIIINTNIVPWDLELWNKFSKCIKCSRTKDLITLWSFILKDSEIFPKFNISKIFNISHVIVNDTYSKIIHPELNAHNMSCILVDKSLKIANFREYPLVSMLCSGYDLSKVAEECGMNLFYEFPYCKLLNEDLIPIVKTFEPNRTFKIYVKKF